MHRLPDHDLWAVARYAEVMSVLRDPERFSSRLGMGALRHLQGARAVDYRIGAPGVRVLIATDPPEHSALRAAVAAPFRTAAATRLAPRVEEIAHTLVEGLLAAQVRGTADIYHDLAAPLPVLVMAELLGVPPEMHGELREWARVITDELADDASADRSLGRGYDMFRYFSRQLRRRRGSTAQDLFSVIAATGGVGLSDYEVMAFCAFLLVAGIETTTNLFTNLVDMLVRFPEVADRLWADPGLADSVVEESLRFDTSVQALWRATTTEVELGGVKLPANARLLVLFGSANRDEEVFPDADRPVLGRTPNPHLAFGLGHHRCLGARLAKLELVAALRALVERTAGVAQRGRWVRTDSLVLRGFVTQPVTVVPR